MSKKTLLKEATVRRFMKLANVSTLSDQLISEMGYHAGARDEEEEADEVDLADEAPEDPADAGPMDEPVEDEPVEDEPADLEGPVDDSAEEVEVTEDERDALAAALPILQKITGGAAEDDMAMDEPMPEDPMAGEEDEAMMEGADLSTKGPNKTPTATKTNANIVPNSGMFKEGEESDDDETLEEVEVVDESELVNEVTRRVAKRLRSILKKRK